MIDFFQTMQTWKRIVYKHVKTVVFCLSVFFWFWTILSCGLDSVLSIIFEFFFGSERNIFWNKRISHLIIWLSGTWILTCRRPLLPDYIHPFGWTLATLDRSNSCTLHCAWASAWLLATQHFGWASATAQATPGCWFAEGNLCMFAMVFFW